MQRSSSYVTQGPPVITTIITNPVIPQATANYQPLPLPPLLLPSTTIHQKTTVGPPVTVSVTRVETVHQVSGPQSRTTIVHPAGLNSQTHYYVPTDRSNRESVALSREERSSSRSVGKFGLSVFNPETGKTVTAKTVVFREHSNENTSNRSSVNYGLTAGTSQII